MIMFPYLGFLLVCLSMIINVYFFRELYVEFLWLENLSAFFGSYVIFLIGCYGFLADTTDQESRTIRIAIMDGCIFSTNILGNYVNGPIYKKFDYFGSFVGLLFYPFILFLLFFFSLFCRWCHLLCSWILPRRTLLQGTKKETKRGQRRQRREERLIKHFVFVQPGQFLWGSGEEEKRKAEAYCHSSLHLLHRWQPQLHWDGLPLFQVAQWINERS